MTTLLERAIATVRKEPEIDKDVYNYNIRRAKEIFNGNTIWEGVKR